MTPIDRQALKEAYQTKGPDGLVLWVRQYRANYWFGDDLEGRIIRRLELLNEGAWKLSDGWIDFSNSETFSLVKTHVMKTLRSARPLSDQYRELAAWIIEVGDAPKRRGRRQSASTPINVSAAYDCILEMEALGIPTYLSDDYNPEGRATACSIVGKAFNVSPSLVEKWWKAYVGQRTALMKP